ncbi:MAG: YdgA family protein [Azoarcus sp.]|jgi:uncharacterized protein YdgA (DUF945 family)|nr:YdgA family protein [Azoarcus sp.]
MKGGAKEKIVGILVVLATLLIGGSFWTGSIIAQEFESGIKRAAEHGFEIELMDYQRGIFGATAQTMVTFTLPTGEKIKIPFLHTVKHGPIPTLFVAGRIHSDPDLQEEQLAQITKAFDGNPFDGNPPPALDTTIGWGGNITTVAAVDKLLFRGKPDTGTARTFEFQNLRVTGGLSAKEETLDTEINVEAHKIIVGGETKDVIETPKLTILLENIDARSVKTVVQDMLKSTDDTVAEEPKEILKDIDEDKAALKKYVSAILLRRPVLSINNVYARWSEGVVTGNFRLVYVGDGNPDTLSDTSVSADLKLEMPRALVTRQLSSQVSEEIAEELEDGEENDVDIKKETSDEVNKQLAKMIQEGSLIEKGTTLTVDAHLSNGELTLNGKPHPIKDLLNLGLSVLPLDVLLDFGLLPF